MLAIYIFQCIHLEERYSFHWIDSKLLEHYLVLLFHQPISSCILLVGRSKCFIVFVAMAHSYCLCMFVSCPSIVGLSVHCVCSLFQLCFRNGSLRFTCSPAHVSEDKQGYVYCTLYTVKACKCIGNILDTVRKMYQVSCRIRRNHVRNCNRYQYFSSVLKQATLY